MESTCDGCRRVGGWLERMLPGACACAACACAACAGRAVPDAWPIRPPPSPTTSPADRMPHALRGGAYVTPSTSASPAAVHTPRHRYRLLVFSVLGVARARASERERERERERPQMAGAQGHGRRGSLAGPCAMCPFGSCAMCPSSTPPCCPESLPPPVPSLPEGAVPCDGVSVVT